MTEEENVDLFNKKIIIEKFQTKTEDGNLVYHEPATYTGNILEETETAWDSEGQEIVSKMKVIIRSNIPNLDNRAKVTLPEGYDPRQPPIVSTRCDPNANGNDLTIILLKI